MTSYSPPFDELQDIQQFGPTLAYPQNDDARMDPAIVPDRLVKTHCCFCGQQCGMQLKVHHNKVIGIEPWYDFPFNKGMMCPKGMKRYLQSSHPDRLTQAIRRNPLSGQFESLPYQQAIQETASQIQALQAQYGHQSVAVLSGASLTTEKAYLMGKFARVTLKTPYIDYNGRLCMVSAGAGNKKAFGIDRSANPWSDILKAELIWISGANVAECAPITTDYIWQAREQQGAKVIVVDPRITPIARTCDLYLPIKPGRDIALFNGVLNLMIQNDWLDHDFIEANTVGFEEVAQHVKDWTPARTAEVTGLTVQGIQQAAEWWGTANSSFMMHARGIEHHSHGVQNVLGAINLVFASGRIGREGCGYGTIVGQANGQGGREHGQKCDQLPGWRDIENPEHRSYIAGVWGVEPDDLPGKGVDAYEIFRKIEQGEIRGLLSLCFNPAVSMPDSDFVKAMLDKLDFFVTIDFFLSETSRHANIVLPGSQQEEDEGTVTQVEGRVIKINKAVDCPGDARQDWRIIQDLAQAMNRPHGMQFNSPKEIFDELRLASKGGVADYYGITYEKIEQQYGIYWPCRDEADPGTMRLFESGSWNPVSNGNGPFYFPDGKARFNVAPYTPPTEETDVDYPIILTTGRVVSQFLSGTQTRRIGPLVDQYPEPRLEIHPKLAERFGIADNDWVCIESRRGSITLRAQIVKTIRPDTVFVPYHWPGLKSINRLTIAAQDPISKIPEYKVCAVRLAKATHPPD